MGLFTRDLDIIRAARFIYGRSYWLNPAVYSHHCRRGLRGAGDTNPHYYMIIAQWLVRLLVGYTLAFGLGYISGVMGITHCVQRSSGLANAGKFAQGNGKTVGCKAIRLPAGTPHLPTAADRCGKSSIMPRPPGVSRPDLSHHSTERGGSHQQILAARSPVSWANWSGV